MQDKKYFKKRVNEIIDAYLIDEPTEEIAVVKMYFRKANGEEQEKCIKWSSDSVRPMRADRFISASEVVAELFPDAFAEFKIIRKED